MSNFDELEKITKLNLNPQVVKTEGAGKAYQAVAQSMALAIQDATDYLRNIEAMAQAAIAVSTEKIVQNPEENSGPYGKTIQESISMVGSVAATFHDIGMKAGDILKRFPSGDDS